MEVARDEDTRREGLQEAELRAAVGEYEPGQWDQIRTDAESALEKIAADRQGLDSQLSELRAIQKLSEMGPGGSLEPVQPAPAAATQPAEIAVAPLAPAREPETRVPEVPAASAPAPQTEQQQSAGHRAGTAAAYRPQPEPQEPPPSAPVPDSVPLEPIASAANAAAGAAARPRSMKSPTGGVSAVKARSEAARPDAAKTLKCPECGTANYPTEWYCERCGGELATM